MVSKVSRGRDGNEEGFASASLNLRRVESQENGFKACKGRGAEGARGGGGEGVNAR